MILTKEQIGAFQDALQPLMQWLHSNCHPHVTVIVDSERAEIVEGLATAKRLGELAAELRKEAQG